MSLARLRAPRAARKSALLRRRVSELSIARFVWWQHDLEREVGELRDVGWRELGSRPTQPGECGIEVAERDHLLNAEPGCRAGSTVAAPAVVARAEEVRAASAVMGPFIGRKSSTSLLALIGVGRLTALNVIAMARLIGTPLLDPSSTGC